VRWNMRPAWYTDAVDARLATIDDRDAAVSALARAFDADPVVNFLLRQDARRARAIETVFDLAFRRWTLPCGSAWIADGGAALWTPPGEWKPLRAGLELARLLGAVGMGRLPRALTVTRRIDRKHPRAPHWYLFAIGVDPERQGRGVGSALLRAVLAPCDARGEAAYLEASTEANARLYARHGFETLEQVDLAEGGPRVHLMWRDARR
jgi:ribosomal protein S18 acetylase RimI-like enzyme